MLLGPRLVYGQQIDPQRATDAQALFEQAMNEMDAGQFATACKKLEEVTRLVPDGVGGKYALGECYERLGKLASAWTQFSFAQQVATRLGQTERAEGARGKAESLKPKLATLTVSVPASLASVQGISIVRDGVELREPQWGTPLYVDAGQHEVVVTASGYSTWKKRVEVLTDGAKAKFSVPENAIKPDAKEQAKAGAPLIPLLITPPAPERTWQKPVGLAISGVGVVCLAAGAISGGFAIAKKNESNDAGHCNAETNRCDDIGVALRDQAVGLGNASTGLLIAGAAVGVGGVVLWLTAPKDRRPVNDNKPSPGENKVQATIEMSSTWIGVRGRF